MKVYLFSALVLSLYGCSYEIMYNSEHKFTYGKFEDTIYGNLLKLWQDSTYVLYHPPKGNHFAVMFINCDTASVGRWSFVSPSLISITSEDNYLEQNGFNYEILLNRRNSDDSLYLNILLPSDVPSLTYNWGFNYKFLKTIVTSNRSIVVSKKDYLLNTQTIDNNLFQFYIERDPYGAIFYNSRLHFDIFEERINTTKYNHITINLPYFNQCFIDFESYNEDYIRVISKDELRWRGKSWFRKE